MTKISEILDFLTELAPTEAALEFDNVGLLLGGAEGICRRLILTLDVSSDAVNEAALKKADLIVSHHPLIFDPIKKLNTLDPTSRKIIRLIENSVSVISMHTNLDAAEEGVSAALAHKLDMDPEHYLNDETKIGLAGRYPKTKFEDFLKKTAAALGCNVLRFQKSKEFVRKLAVCGGAGGDELVNVKRLGCDTYLTSDIKYHVWHSAKELGISLIDAGHFETENPVINVLADKLKVKFPDAEVLISDANRSPVSYYTYTG